MVNKNIYYFAMDEFSKGIDISKIGIRGKRIMEVAKIKMPILPGIIINSDIASKLASTNLRSDIEFLCKKIESHTGKVFGSVNNPAILKAVISPSLEIVQYPSLHSIGLTDTTIEGFKEIVGENFAYHEYAHILIKGVVKILITMYGTEKNEDGIEKLNKFIEVIDKSKTVDEYKQVIEKAKEFLPKEFFEDPFYQLDFILNRISVFLNSEEMDDEDTAIIVQPMVYGNYGKDSYSGNFYTRNIVSGEKKIQGKCYENKFDERDGGSEIDINEIDEKYKQQLEDIADRIECYYKEIREIRFTIEQGKFWIINYSSVMTMSTQAELKSLLYLLDKKIIDEQYLITRVKPSQVSEILHPIIDPAFTKKFETIDGGIAGAPGAAKGRIYFSTDGLIEAKRKAIALEQDLNFILCLPATYAEDVKAIEDSRGVISNEGGYSAHASVVARQYGKVSLVKPDMKIDVKKKQFSIGKTVVKEGDYITLDVPFYGEPQILLGNANLIEPDPHESGLMELIKLSSKFIKDFKILGNADTPKDAATVKLFGGEGIGLCRTEHMFFGEDRINIFREMIMADDPKERNRTLKKLQTIQKKDFYGIFKTMHPFPVTIRLLDAPLHEFLPHTEDELNDFLEYLQKSDKTVTKEDVDYKCETVQEVNPMLGHRGCRLAITYPEIYEMQIRALFEAAYQLLEEGTEVVPEIMIPIVMNTEEVKIIRYGKRIEGGSIQGIYHIERDVREKAKPKKALKYKAGTMIELPSAALQSNEIAKYADFFSFGTNDLTQTTHGLSRDDFNVFMPDYSLYDLINSNPFKVLTEPVKELIMLATERGRLTRPDLKIGLCGEQGAEPKNLEYLRDVGLNYVSCSSYSIPIAKLKIAQMEIERAENN